MKEQLDNICLPLPKDFVINKVPSKFIAMATGVTCARQDKTGKVELVYEDGTIESALLDYDIFEEENFFKIVDEVQTIARA